MSAVRTSLSRGVASAGILLGLLVCPCRVGASGTEVVVPWEMEALMHAPPVHPAPADVPVPEGVAACRFEGPPYKGKPTRVFAYYGLPKGSRNRLSKNRRYPRASALLRERDCRRS